MTDTTPPTPTPESPWLPTMPAQNLTGPPSVTTAPAAPVKNYTSSVFHVLFEDWEHAKAFVEDPFFRNENPHQSAVHAAIAKAAALPFVVAFTLFHAAANGEGVTGTVRDLAHAYEGWLDGENKPEPEPEPDPAAAPVKDAAPWS